MEQEELTASAGADGKIVCQIDNARVHSVQIHIRDNHPDWTIEKYQATYPDAPIFSETAKARLAARKAEKKNQTAVAQVENVRRAFLHDVFGLGASLPEMMTAAGTPVEITVFGDPDEEALPFVATVDSNYVFNSDLLKKVIVAFELNMPCYLWGYHGTGKTTIFEQICARTRRPFVRVQHTINTEESHILGQYVVRSRPVQEEVIDATGAKHSVTKQSTVTEFQLGPLPMAMIHGWAYCADEYDYAMPSVAALYQAVLEGKPLVIKEAPPEFRVIKPHPDFRIMATGNTNGVGDETGLYQGTLIQNAANYSRFTVCEEVEYMEPKVEELVVMSQAMIERPDAVKLVKFAKQVREAFKDGKISMTISPRELIGAAKLSMAFRGNWAVGVKMAYANRCSRIDKKVIEELCQRIWN